MVELSDDFRTRVQSISRQLSRKWRENHEYSTGLSNTWDEDKMSILQSSGFNWVSDAGSRTVCGVSRCLEGVPATGSFTPIVVKFQPEIDDEWNPNQYQNQRTIKNWNRVKSNGDTELFGTLVDYDDEGAWVAMKEYIPIVESEPENIDRDYLIDKQREEIISARKKIESEGYSWNDCVVGYDPWNDSNVIIDYGTMH